MIDEPEIVNRVDNLWAPGDENEDHGAHGVFDDRARPVSVQMQLNKHRGLVFGLLALLGAAVTMALYGRAHSDRHSGVQ